MKLNLHTFKLLRTHQWLKNTFVLAPLFFSGQFTNWHNLTIAFTVAVAFSLLASAVYCFNDIKDVNADRLHPTKKDRPIANGNVSVSDAYKLMAILVTLALAITLTIPKNNWNVITVMAAYFLINVAYCAKLKHVTILDVFIVAAGFVFRVFAGGIATQTFVSHWIILMTFLLALFLTFAKRRDDIILASNSNDQQNGQIRQNLHRYSLDFINQTLSIIAAITIVCYIMYTVSPEVMVFFNTAYLYITAVFVIAGMIRYLQITIVDVKSGSPTKVLIHDRFIQACVAGWGVTFFAIIYA